MGSYFKGWFQGKTAKKYLLSYVLISILPVIFISALYCYQSVRSVSGQRETQLLASMEQLKNEFDGSITAMETSSAHFSNLILSTQRADPESIPGYGDSLVQQLNTYYANAPFPCEILYYPRSGIDVYTLEGKTDYNSFQKSRGFRNELEMIQFYKNLNSIKNRMLLTTRTLLGEDAGHYLIYLTPIPALDTKPAGTMAFIMDRQNINDLATNFCGEFSGYLYIFDPFFDVSYGLDRYGAHTSGQVEKALSGLRGTGIVRHRIEGEPFLSVRVVSRSYGFTYVLSLPLSGFYQPVFEQVNLFAGLILALLMMSLAAAVWIAVENYKPIRRLAEDLLHGEITAPGTDLFDQLRSLYRDMVLQKDSLQMQIKNQNDFARQQVLENLINGWHSSRQGLQDAMGRAGFSFGYPGFFVAAARLGGRQEARQPALDCVKQAAASKPYGDLYFLETDSPGVLAVIVNTGQGEAARLETARCLRAGLVEAGWEHAALGVGMLYEDPLRIEMSFCEALAAVQDSGEPVAIFQQQEPDGGDFLCPAVEGSMFRQSLQSGNGDLAVELLGRMAGRVEERHPPYLLAKCFCFYITGLLLQAGSAAGIELEIRDLAHAAEGRELHAYQREAEAAARQLCRQIHEQRRCGEEKLAEGLMAYLQEHFGDYTLSAETLAGQFQISENHVRRILKEQTGGSLSAYITGLRFAYIKNQLRETDIPVRELISRVGYTDVSSFIRKFKAAEGVTPGQYRSMSRRP